MQKKLEFSKQEWKQFGVSNLSPDTYIKSGEKIFKPAGRRITMLCLMLRKLPASQARDLRVLLEPVLQE